METNRLIIRPFTKQDLSAFFAIYSNEETNRFLPWFPVKTMAEAALQFEKYCNKKENRRMALCRKEDNIPFGYINLSLRPPYDLGYAVLPQFKNKGYVTEAATSFITQLKEEGHPYITATHDVLNIASGRIMQKTGMHYCYTYEEHWMPKDFMVNFRMYQLNLNGNHPVYEEYRNMTENWRIEPDLFMNADIEKTKEYYANKANEYRNDYERGSCLINKFRNQYPLVEKLLSFYGVDVQKPLEIIEKDFQQKGTIRYELKGNCYKNKGFTVQGLYIDQSTSYPKVNDTFVIQIQSCHEENN